MQKPQKIWVLYGGNSAERDVSLSSGKEIHQALLAENFQAELYDVSPGASLFQLPWFDSEKKPDIVFLGLHGTFGEDGTVQGFLESIQIPFVGSGSYSSAVCFNKETTKILLQKEQVPVPHSFPIHNKDRLEHSLDSFIENTADFLNKKFFVKATRQGSSIGTAPYFPEDHKDKRAALVKICQDTFHFDRSIIIEEFIQGRELTCTLFKGEALPIIEIKPKVGFYDYKNKYTSGQSEYVVPAEIPDSDTNQIKEISEKAFKILECSDYARCDFIYQGENKFKFLEMNTLPGMTPTSLVPKAAKATGLNFGKFLTELISYSFFRGRKTGNKAG